MTDSLVRRVEGLSRIRLRYFKRLPWENRFTRTRRAFREVRAHRPLLTSLHMARIMGTVKRHLTDEVVAK